MCSVWVGAKLEYTGSPGLSLEITAVKKTSDIVDSPEFEGDIKALKGEQSYFCTSSDQ